MKILTVIIGVAFFLNSALCSISENVKNSEEESAMMIEESDDLPEINTASFEELEKRIKNDQSLFESEIPVQNIEDKEAIDKLELLIILGLKKQAADLILAFIMGKHKKNLSEFQELVAMADEDLQQEIFERLITIGKISADPDCLLFFLKGFQNSKFFPQTLYQFRLDLFKNKNITMFVLGSNYFYEVLWDVLNDNEISDDFALQLCGCFRIDCISIAIALRIFSFKSKPKVNLLFETLIEKKLGLISEFFIRGNFSDLSEFKKIVLSHSPDQIELFCLNVTSSIKKGLEVNNKLNMVHELTSFTSPIYSSPLSSLLKFIAENGDYHSFSYYPMLLTKADNGEIPLYVEEWIKNIAEKGSAAEIELLILKSIFYGYLDMAKIFIKAYKSRKLYQA